MSAAHFLFHADGGSRGNPGPAAAAFTVQQNDKLIFEHAEVLGVKTNNEAEYAGVLLSLAWLKKLPPAARPSSATWQLDSLLVVQQLSGRWRVKHAHLQRLKTTCLTQLAEIFPQKTYIFTHIPRAQNSRADALVNLALNAQKSR